MPDNVIISGENFSKIDAATLSVKVGSTSATGITVVSDSEIHASYPALTAGKYPRRRLHQILAEYQRRPGHRLHRMDPHLPPMAFLPLRLAAPHGSGMMANAVTKYSYYFYYILTIFDVEWLIS